MCCLRSRYRILEEQEGQDPYILEEQEQILIFLRSKNRIFIVEEQVQDPYILEVQVQVQVLHIFESQVHKISYYS